MNRAYKRIAAATLAVMGILSAGSIVKMNMAAPPLGISSLGNSGDLLGNGPDLGHSGGTDHMDVPSMRIPVGTFSAMKTLIESAKGDISLEMTQSITMTGFINVPADISVTVDGMGEHTIEQSGEYRFLGGDRTHITLKDMAVIGRHTHGIIQSAGVQGKATFDHIDYVGTQPYYGSGTGSEMVIKNGGSYEIKKYDSASMAPEELCQNAFLTFDGGITTITHAINDSNSNSVFFMTLGATGHIRVRDKAQVSVTTGNYLIYSDIKPIDITIESGSSLNVVAPAFTRDEGHYIGDFTMEDNTWFSYEQKGSSYYSNTLKEIYITRSLTIGEDSVFLYNSTQGLRSTGTNTLNSPKVVSIYSTNGAFYNTSGAWAVNRVNAVNYWNKSAKASPDQDSAGNWPDYIWNAWNLADDRSGAMGSAFSFSGTAGQGVTSGGVITDAVGRSSETLKGTLQFNSSAGRVVMGSINPFTVEKADLSMDGIYGVVACTDLMASYPITKDETVMLFDTQFPLRYGSSPKPQGGSKVTVVANLMGLRAAIFAQAQGTLDLVEAPEKIYFGEHEITASTTIYERESDSLPGEPEFMRVRVRDSRGDESTKWSLMVEATDESVPGRQMLPSSTLIFITDTGREYSLANGAVVVHTQEKSGLEPMDYDLEWNGGQGLLAKIPSGAMGPGQYATVINWSVQVTPEEV